MYPRYLLFYEASLSIYQKQPPLYHIVFNVYILGITFPNRF